jgi:hypothetical protein
MIALDFVFTSANHEIKSKPDRIELMPGPHDTMRPKQNTTAPMFMFKPSGSLKSA